MITILLCINIDTYVCLLLQTDQWKEWESEQQKVPVYNSLKR